MIRRAAFAAVLLLLLSTASVSAGFPQTVEMKNFFFDAATVKIPVGDSVEWHNPTAATNHTSTANLFNTWNRTIGPGDSDQVLFARAGTFAYHCSIHPQMQGKVKVRMTSNSDTAVVGIPLVLRVATVNPPTGFKEDVQKRKGSKPFKSWLTTSNQTVNFTASRVGTYQFRARLRRVSDGTHTGWSQPLTIQVN